MLLCRLFVDELKVMNLLQTLQQYFFMAAGDWAENLTEAVCAHTAQHSTLHEHSMQSMVDSSLKGTSVELDSNAANLRATLKVLSHTAGANRASPASRASPTSEGASPSTSEACQGRAAVVIDNTQLHALHAVQLSFDVQWPLSLVVTQVQIHSILFK